MTVFDERPTSSPAFRRLRLLALPVLAGLAGFGILAAHSPHSLPKVPTMLQEFRGEAPGETGSNQSMADALSIRRGLILHPGVKLSPVQSGTLIQIVGGPVNEQSQSEALDVLSLAQRARALSPPQSQQAQDAALRVLQTSPGPMVRLESARLLGHIGGSGGVSALTALSLDGDPKIQEAARQALARRQK